MKLRNFTVIIILLILLTDMSYSQDRFDEIKRLAEKGDVVAQMNLGNKYYVGEGVPQNFTEAVKWYRKAADQGNAVAQFNLGVMYAKGQGVAKSDTEAAKWYRKAATQGSADSQNNLGVMYRPFPATRFVGAQGKWTKHRRKSIESYGRGSPLSALPVRDPPSLLIGVAMMYIYI